MDPDRTGTAKLVLGLVVASLMPACGVGTSGPEPQDAAPDVTDGTSADLPAVPERNAEYVPPAVPIGPSAGLIHQLPPELLADPTQVTVRTTCHDLDGDGYGQNCLRGLDCDDGVPTITDECYRCVRPGTGCTCSEEGAVATCDSLTDGDALTSGDTCQPGIRTCESGRWSRCVAVPNAPHVLLPPGDCQSPCNRECRTTTACPSTMGDLAGRSMNIQLAGRPAPGFCGAGAPAGGIQLSGGMDPPPPVDCPQSCGGACCRPDETCVSRTETAGYNASCMALGITPPPPVRISVCARDCAEGTTRCGEPPNAVCCNPSTEVCVESRCQPIRGSCNPDAPNSCVFSTAGAPFLGGNYVHNHYMCRGINGAQCANSQYCDVRSGTCVDLDGAGANGCQNCRGYVSAQRCMQRAVAGGGEVVNGIFRTNNGLDARFLSFARYLPASTRQAVHGGCLYGRSNSPNNCASYTCCNGEPEGCPGGAARETALSGHANFLDWKYMWLGRLNGSDGIIGDGNGDNYVPTRGAIFDLGAPANRVVMFPTTDHVTDSCLEAFEYTIWLTDNLAATEVAPADHPDPNKWNVAVLTQVFTQGWTRNPNARGSSEAMQPAAMQSDLETTAFGDATADAMATVWTLPCGFTARYASVVAGNFGNPGQECTFHSFDAEFDAIAGLSLEGNGLSIFHRLPYGATAGPDGVQFSTRLRSADIYFLMDTTGSMGGSIANLQARLTSGSDGGIINAIRRVIPNSQFGVGRIDDFPVSPYGGSIDTPYQNLQDITPNISQVQSAVTSLSLHGGSDWPESQLMGLYAVSTGSGLGSYRAARTGCPANTFGYPCFRLGAIPIVMLFTDAPVHNRSRSPNYAYDNSAIGFTTPTYTQTVNAMRAAGVKLIWVDSSGGSQDSLDDGTDLTSATMSFAQGGSPAVYPISYSGTGLGEAVVQGVEAIANYARMDVNAIAEDNPATAVDERCFIDSPPDADYGSVRLSDPSFGESEPFSAGQCSGVEVRNNYKIRALQCLPGTPINFRARFRNNCVMPTGVDQTFTFDIVVRGNNIYELGRVPVTILVPRVQYAPQGTFVETINALDPANPASCGPGRVPDWTTIQLVSETPDGTSINVDAITGDSVTELDNPNASSHNRWIQVGRIPPSSSPLNLGAAFMTSTPAISNRHSMVRVRFTLNSDPMRIRTPTLTGYRIQFNCVDGT